MKPKEQDFYTKNIGRYVLLQAGTITYEGVLRGRNQDKDVVLNPTTRLNYTTRRTEQIPLETIVAPSAIIAKMLFSDDEINERLKYINDSYSHAEHKKHLEKKE